MMNRKAGKDNLRSLAAMTGLTLIGLVLLLPGRTGCCQPVQADGSTGCRNVTLLLKERSAVSKEKVLLGDIASVQGTDAALTGKLGRIQVGKSPLPGSTVIITSQGILHQLKREYPDPLKISFSGPDRCLVERKYREITAEEVERLFRQRFFEQFSDQEFELEKVRVSLSQPVKVPEGDDGGEGDGGAIEFEVPFTGPPGRQEESYTVRIKHKGEVLRQIRVLAAIRYHAMILVAARDLGKGEIITAGDVTQKAVVLDYPDPDGIGDSTRIVGMTCRQPVRAGSELTLKMVEQPLLIRKGAIIKMTVESNNLRIVGFGRARADGRQGEIIPAENLTSQGNVYGKVIGENQIQVTF
ncbi:MAG: flagellar basal body P-ring formation chaperone FlgA [bacterium]